MEYRIFSLTCIHGHSYACVYTQWLGTSTASEHSIFDSEKLIEFPCDGIQTRAMECEVWHSTNWATPPPQWWKSPLGLTLSHPFWWPWPDDQGGGGAITQKQTIQKQKLIEPHQTHTHAGTYVALSSFCDVALSSFCAASQVQQQFRRICLGKVGREGYLGQKDLMNFQNLWDNNVYVAESSVYQHNGLGVQLRVG